MATAPEGRATRALGSLGSPPDKKGEQGQDHRADSDALPEVCVIGVKATKRLADLSEMCLDYANVHAVTIAHDRHQPTPNHAEPRRGCPHQHNTTATRQAYTPHAPLDPRLTTTPARDPQVPRVTYGLGESFTPVLLTQVGVSPALLVVKVLLPLLVSHTRQGGRGLAVVIRSSHPISMP